MPFEWNNEETINLLKKLVEIPSPSGYTYERTYTNLLKAAATLLYAYVLSPLVTE